MEPFDDEFTTAHLYALTRASRAPIKAFLLDQKRIAGVGNIYADEALFRARIHPLRPANRLTRAQVDALREARHRVAERGDRGQGRERSTTSATPTASRGTFQDRFLVHLREGQPCTRCGRPGAQAARRGARDVRLREMPA